MIVPDSDSESLQPGEKFLTCARTEVSSSQNQLIYYFSDTKFFFLMFNALRIRVTRVENEKVFCINILKIQMGMVVALFHKSNLMLGCTFIDKSHRGKGIQSSQVLVLNLTVG